MLFSTASFHLEAACAPAARLPNAPDLQERHDCKGLELSLALNLLNCFAEWRRLLYYGDNNS